MASPTDSAAIARQLRTDSEALRYAEWWTRRKIYGLEDQQLRWLRDQYLAAYKEIISTLPDAYDSGGQPRLEQRARLLAAIERELTALLDTVEPSMRQSIEDGFRQGYYGRAWLLDSVTVQGWSPKFAQVIPSEAIRALLVADYIGTDDWIALERGELISRIKSSLTQSLIQGEGMAKARARLVKELGIKPGQTKSFKGSMWRALLITRTEIMRASNLGALTIYEQNQDVLSGWEWVATLDERTCPICGGLDGKTFAFGSSQLQPPSGSHPGCRCTIVPVLRDTELMDRVLGRPRETYCEWALKRGIVDDAELCSQRGASPPKAADPLDQKRSASQVAYENEMRINQSSIDLARGITPDVLHSGAASGALADYMYSFFAYDDMANPTFSPDLIDQARLDTLFSVYTLGRGQVKQQTINDVRLQSAAILSADDFLGKKVLSKADRVRLTALSSPDDDVVLAAIDDTRDRRLKGTLAQKEEAARSRGQTYDAFVSAAAADGAQRLREASMPWFAQR